jgi:hypothetical protein
MSRNDLYERVSAVVRYNRETGQLITIIDRRNSPKGTILGSITKTGYVYVSFERASYPSHRLIWLLETGAFPPEGIDIDHINGNRCDNRWSNLRLATRSENQYNAKIRSDSSTGIKGLSRIEGGYTIQIVCSEKSKRIKKYFYIKNFESVEQCLAAAILVLETIREVNHKDFANHG